MQGRNECEEMNMSTTSPAPHLQPSAPTCPGNGYCESNGMAIGGNTDPMTGEWFPCPYGCKTVEDRQEAGECTCYEEHCSVHPCDCSYCVVAADMAVAS